jgi:hypothetical protein
MGIQFMTIYPNFYWRTKRASWITILNKENFRAALTNSIIKK